VKGLKRGRDGTLEVDLRSFSDQSWLARMRGDPFPVDPFLISRVLTAGMSEASVRDAEGHRILANFLRLVLHPDDFEELMRVRVTLHRQIGPLLQRHATTSGAVLIDAPAATFVPDESGTLPRGHAALRPEIRETQRLPQDKPGEVTLRFTDSTPGPAGTPPSPLPGPAFAPPSAPPARAGEPTGRLLWSGGRADLVAGTRYAFGRPHDGAPPRFIALEGAPIEVSRVQAWVELHGSEVRVGRAGANPVRVQGRSIQPGGEITVSGARVEVLLGETFAVTIVSAGHEP
jgi:hypothetical protein